MRKLLALLLLASPCYGQAHHSPFRRVVGDPLVRTFYTDFKEHPVSHGVTMALRFGVAFADTGSSCALRMNGQNYREVGYAHFFIGPSPNCRKLVTLSLVAETVHVTSVNYLAHAFKNSCDREAANPD